jgi:hypothetical protein
MSNKKVNALKVHFKKTAIGDLEDFGETHAKFRSGHVRDDKYYNAILVVVTEEESEEKINNGDKE